MSELWNLEFRAPRTVALSRDRVFEHAFHLHGSGPDSVQIGLGARVLLQIVRADGERCVIAGEELGERVLDDVVGIAAFAVAVVSSVPDVPVFDVPVFDVAVLESAEQDAPAHDAAHDEVPLHESHREHLASEPLDSEPSAAEELDTDVTDPTACFPLIVDDTLGPAFIEGFLVEEVNPEPVLLEEQIHAELLSLGDSPASESAPSVLAAPPAASDPLPAGDLDSTIPDAPIVEVAAVSGDLDVTVPGSQTPAPSREADFAATVVGRALPAILGGDLDATIVGSSAGVGAARNRARATAPRPTRIRVVDGSEIVEHELSGVMYVGRAPELPVEADPRRSSLVAVVSAGETVADTHAQLTAGDGLVLVRDLWSTGGTRVEQPNGGSFQLLPGEQIPVARGARILLGNGVVLETGG